MLKSFDERDEAIDHLRVRREDGRNMACSLIGVRCIRKAPLKYWVHGNKPFIKEFSKMLPYKRVFYEAIMPSEPCRLFFNFECEGLTREQGDKQVSAIVEIISERLRRWATQFPGEIARVDKDHMVLIESMVLLDRSREGKYSVRVVFPDLWFESPVHIYAFMMFPVLIDPDIDVQVYATNNFPTFMCMPLCQDQDEPGLTSMQVRRPLSGPFAQLVSRCPLERTEDILAHGCVTSGGLASDAWYNYIASRPPSCRLVHLRIHQQEIVRILGWGMTLRLFRHKIALPCNGSKRVSRNNNPSENGLSDVEFQDTIAGIQTVFHYIKAVQGEHFTFRNVKVHDRFSWSCLVSPGLWCPYCLRRDAQPHQWLENTSNKRNNMHIGMMDGKYLYQQCMDEACAGKKYYWPQNFSCAFGTLVDVGEGLREELLAMVSPSLPSLSSSLQHSSRSSLGNADE